MAEFWSNNDRGYRIRLWIDQTSPNIAENSSQVRVRLAGAGERCGRNGCVRGCLRHRSPTHRWRSHGRPPLTARTRKRACHAAAPSLLGACDGVIEIDKDGDLVTLKTEKRRRTWKGCADLHAYEKGIMAGWAQRMAVQHWCRLSPSIVRSDLDKWTTIGFSKPFTHLTGAWADGRPLSTAPEFEIKVDTLLTRTRRRFGLTNWSPEYLTAWLENGCLSIKGSTPTRK